MSGRARLALAVSTVAAILVPTLTAGPSGAVFGNIADIHGRALADAQVLIQSTSKGTRWRTRSGVDGDYKVNGLEPGRYKVTVRLPGFRTVSRVGAVVDRGARLQIDFSMELLGLHEVITVTSERDALNPSTASSLLMARDSPGAALPANGGDYRVLFDMMPGVVITPAATNDAGQFTSNGQRPNSNIFRVDGVSVNTGIGSSVLPGAFPGASLPAMTALGSTENLVSNETAQSVELRTSDFAPELSERPGAESLVHTRSGSNAFHEEFFGHIRDNGWNARDWFANSRGIDSPRPFYRKTGLVFGGPLLRNRTFFFLSGEEASLADTGIQLTTVPSLEARQSAPDKLKPILNFYPQPSGKDLGGGVAEGVSSLNANGELLSTSLRIDQSLGRKGNLFARLVESPSKAAINRFNWASGTLGITVGGAGGAIHDIRLNYSRADLLFSVFGGGPAYANAVFAVAGLLPGFTVLPDGSALFQFKTTSLTTVLPQVAGSETITGLSVPGLGQFISSGSGNAQQGQVEVRETFSKTIGRHEVRAGIDYVRLQPSRSHAAYAVLGVASSLTGLLNGSPLSVTSSALPQRGETIHEVSLFAQDTFRLNEHLSLMYGLGWELTPPVGTRTQIPTVSGLWTGTDWQGALSGDIEGQAAWPMRFGQVAPRMALAYRVGRGFVVRAGAGLFQDVTLGASLNPINGAPFNSWQLASGGAAFETSPDTLNATTGGGGAKPPEVARFLGGIYPALRLPASFQWRVGAERQVGSGGTGSISYVGAANRNLLGHEAYVDPSSGVLKRLLTLTQNSSNYQALQMRYGGSLARSIYGSVSYTWAHSIDDGSQDSSVFLIHPGYRFNEARGSSNFDVRHALTAALSYSIPRASSLKGIPPGLAGWTLSAVLRARTGFPIDILNSDQPLGQGFDNVGRPDPVPGAPIWMPDAHAPGGRRLNPAAFSVPAAGREGTLGRNAITGNALAQVDVSLRREFPIYREISVEVGLNVFNVLNHPAFADPVPFLASPWFGLSTSMQNLMFGSGSPNTGLPALFQTGGARSAELSFRVSF